MRRLNCKSRGLLACVIAPKPGAPSCTPVVSGLKKLGWLSRLKDAARNWPLTRSKIRKLRDTVRPRSVYFGPLMEVLPAFATWPGCDTTTLTTFNDGARLNAAVLSH